MHAFKAELLASTSPLMIDMGRELFHGYYWGARQARGIRSSHIVFDEGIPSHGR